MAYVSARLRVPGPMAYVTGGNLTNIGSPVFSADGVAVGIVLQQLPNAVTLSGEGGKGSVLLSGQRENSCFIPVEDFANVLKNPPAPGKRMTWIGIRFGKYAEDVVPLGVPAVKADKVYADSPAAKAGIKDGETVIALNDQPIEKLSTPDLMVQNFTRLIGRLPAGTKITLTLHRVPKDEKVELTTEAIPTTPAEAKKFISQTLGFVVRNKVPLDAALDTSATSKIAGVYLVGVAQKSPAETAGLKAGNEYTLIVSVNGKPVKDVDEFKKFAEETPAKPLNLLVQKGDQHETVTIAPGAPSAPK
jgi:S1-C subfamily serine protease